MKKPFFYKFFSILFILALLTTFFIITPSDRVLPMLDLPIKSFDFMKQGKNPRASAADIPKLSKLESNNITSASFWKQAFRLNDNNFSLDSNSNVGHVSASSVYINGTIYRKNDSAPAVGIPVVAFLASNIISSGFGIQSFIGVAITNQSGVFELYADFFIQGFGYVALMPIGGNITFLGPLASFGHVNFFDVSLSILTDLTLMSFIGISKLNSSIASDKNNWLYLRENTPASVLTFQAIDHETKELILEERLYFAGWFAEQGALDFVMWLPAGKNLDLRVIFYANDIGWVDRILQVSTINMTAQNASFVLLPLLAAEQSLKNTKQYFHDIETAGFDLSPYVGELEQAENQYNIAKSAWQNSTPIFAGFETQLDENGEKALFYSELSIIHSLRAKTSAELQYRLLTEQPVEFYLVSIWIISFIIGFFLSKVLVDRKLYQLVIRYSVFLGFSAIIFMAHPLVKHAFLNKSLIFDIGIPPGSMSLALELPLLISYCVSFLPALLILYLPLPKKLDEIYVFFLLAIRNLRRRVERTSLTFLTLLVVVSGFILLVSVSYQGSVTIAPGIPVEASYEGIKIRNVHDVKLTELRIKDVDFGRLPVRTEIIVDTALEFSKKTNISYTLRDQLSNSQFGGDPLDVLNISIKIPQRQSNITIEHRLANYLAVSAASEPNVSHMDQYIVAGSWFHPVNTSRLYESEVLISESLAKMYNLKVNDSIEFLYNISLTPLTIPVPPLNIPKPPKLVIVGIFNDSLTTLRDIDGSFVAPYRYAYDSETREWSVNGYTNASEFIIVPFEWFRYALADFIKQVGFGFASTKITPAWTMVINSNDLEFASLLADLLDPLRVQLTKRNEKGELELINMKFVFKQKIEGIIPQLIPVTLSILIIAQVVTNAVWERRKEMQNYGSLGLTPRRTVLLIVLEYITLGMIAGGVAYFVGLVLFPVVKALNIGTSFTQKTHSIYAFFALFMAMIVSFIGTIPAIIRFYQEIVPHQPKKLAELYYTDNLRVPLPLKITATEFNHFIEFIQEKMPQFSFSKDSENTITVADDNRNVRTYFLTFSPLDEKTNVGTIFVTVKTDDSKKSNKVVKKMLQRLENVSLEYYLQRLQL